MLDTNELGYCGVICSTCSDFISSACPGCRASVWPEGDACPPVACCWERGITVCGLCDDFPCSMMVDFYDESESHRRAGELMQQVFRETFGPCEDDASPVQTETSEQTSS